MNSNTRRNKTNWRSFS